MKKIFLYYILLIAFIAGCKEEPTALHYDGFDIEMSKTEYFVDKGAILTFQCEVICEYGIKEYQVAIPAWNSDSEDQIETVDVYGSPKKYKVEHSITLPDNIELEQNEITLTVYDYKGESVSKTITAKIKTDTVKPELSIKTPVNNEQHSPKEDLIFDFTATDDLKIKNVTIQCEKIGFNKEYIPDSNNSREIKVYDNLDLEDLGGIYTFIITATDAQENSISEEVNVIVTIPSKPGIFKVDGIPYCGVAGGKLKLVYDIETSYDCTITNINIKSDVLGIDMNIDNTNSSEYKLEQLIDINSNIGYKRNVPITITATNNIGEVTTFTDYCNIIDKLYIIGRGTLAREKEGKAIEMTRSFDDNSAFEIITYIEKVGEGVKFLSEQNWNGLNLGIDANNKIINDGNSNFITTSITGYYKVKFNGATWEYSIEPHTPETEPEHEEMYIFGYRFLYWDNGVWNPQTGWNTLFKMNKYPDNPHRFYIDIKTGPDQIDGNWERRAIFKFAAQNNINDGGTFYGMQENAGDQYVWWEYVGKIYRFDKAGETPNLCEDSRSDAEMRIVIDTYLDQMSWMPKDQYQ